MDAPTLPFTHCPLCKSSDIILNSDGEYHECYSCALQWTNPKYTEQSLVGQIQSLLEKCASTDEKDQTYVNPYFVADLIKGLSSYYAYVPSDEVSEWATGLYEM